MFGFDDMAMGMMGLGLAGDAFGAYSQYQAQQRQRDLYNKYQEQANKLRDPMYMIGQATPIYNANLANLQQALPSLMRTTVNPMLGQQGLDPAGGAAQSILQQTVAQQQQQAWQNAMQQASGNNQLAMNAYGGAGGMIGQPTGQMGGTANALQSLMLLQALNRRNSPQQTGGTDTSNIQAPSYQYPNMFAPGSFNINGPSDANPLTTSFKTQEFAY